jgi:hypothetical protein
MQTLIQFVLFVQQRALRCSTVAGQRCIHVAIHLDRTTSVRSERTREPNLLLFQEHVLLHLSFFSDER